MQESNSSFDYFFKPKSVAVIGASSNRLKIGGIVMSNMINDGYQGDAFPINPTATEILGHKCYSSVLDVTEPIDVAVIVVPAKLVPPVMEDCAKKGIKGVVIISSGFAEAGPDGELLQQEIVRIGRESGMRIIGPNCLGIISTHSKLNASFGMPIKNYGNIAFVSQSGALADGIFGWAQDKGIGFSVFVSIGNKSDVDEADLVEYLLNDENTSVICLYIEGIRDGRKFIKSTREVAKQKPIIAIKGGLTTAGAKAASSHTGSLAGSAQIYDAAFRKAGVLHVSSMEDLMDAARVLGLQPPAKGDRIVIVTDAGGMGIIAADVCELSGLEVPEVPQAVQKEIRKHIPTYGSARNPIDLTGTGTPTEVMAMYENVVRIVQESGIADILLLCVEGSYPPDFIKAMKDVFINKIGPTLRTPTIVSWLGAESLIGACFEEIESKVGIPVFLTPERAAKACTALVNYGRFLATV